jgi:hypothetical protein
MKSRHQKKKNSKPLPRGEVGESANRERLGGKALIQPGKS